jgi:NADPH:quinone reductase-like Zn-dependent oxidoreductase
MSYKAVAITKVGAPDVLQVVEKEMPVPGPEQALVKVLYCGVGYTDAIMRSGFYPHAPKKMMPFVPGYEIIGTISACGKDLKGFQPGDKVCALTITRGYAEYALLNHDELIKVPDGLDDQQAVALILNYTTAYQMLHRIAHVKVGQTAFFSGAGGGVGSALLELGKLAGLNMYGLCSTSRMDSVQKRGATPIDYTRADFRKVIKAAHPNGIDAAFDALGGKYLLQCASIVSKSGLLVSFGMTTVVSNGKTNLIGLIQSMGGLNWLQWRRGKDKVPFYGITDLYLKDKQPLKSDLNMLFQLLADKKLTPEIGHVFPLTEARAANELLESGKAKGKIILDCR